MPTGWRCFQKAFLGKKSLPWRNATRVTTCVSDQVTAASSCWPGLQEFILKKDRVLFVASGRCFVRMEFSLANLP